MQSAFIWSLALYGLLPYAVWQIVVLVHPSADVRGPYLVASPFIAVALVFIPIVQVFWKRGLWDPKEAVPGPADLQQSLLRYMDALGLDQIELLEGDDGRVFIRSRERVALLSTHDWGTLDQEQREFLLARTLASTFAGSHGNAKWFVQNLVLAAGMLAACFNLWWVLVAHSSYAFVVGVLFWGQNRSRAISADRAALRLTRNLGAAIAVVRRNCGYDALSDEQDRILALQKEASTLGIS